MIEPFSSQQRRQPRSFLAAYALAWAGGLIAYTPFLTVLLPIRFSVLAGGGDVAWLALCATIGAIAAGLSNIVWGWASDRWPAGPNRARLRWTMAGLAATAGGMAAIVAARHPATLLMAVACWQVGLNLLLAPLSAYAADSVGDEQKGVLGGFLSFAPALSAVSVIGVAAVGGGFERQMGLIFLIVAGMMLPLLLRGHARAFGQAEATPDRHDRALDRRILWRLWLSRLFVQVAEGLLFLFIYYFLRSVSGGALSLGEYAWTNAIVQILAIPVALAMGRLSDRYQRRKAPLLAMIGLIMIGLAGMALAHSWLLVVCCYGIFLSGSNSFLALHSAFAMQQLPDRRHFGRDLGLFNLTNTLPSLISPLLAAVVIGQLGYQSLLMILAALMLVPALLLSRLAIR
ncbi:MFS transporter [Sphingomonas sp. KRR8]|uniref:MFS transporter n=1 Tax=Sphingomonas sp. KRR8 TaxID=2942996 RepID=UPI00201FFE22|nr:MFS transporter [Sphingomonas sp. KRR8]URD60896.1 MFS transporter [Sphingomonas sp. KRR8]